MTTLEEALGFIECLLILDEPVPDPCWPLCMNLIVPKGRYEGFTATTFAKTKKMTQMTVLNEMDCDTGI